MTDSLEERLERGELITFEPCHFTLPSGDDLAFLMQQQLGGSAHKNISYNPADRAVSGFAMQSPEQADRLQALMSDFSHRASQWLGDLLPRYAAAWQLDRASLRPEEEATRKLRLTARNDLLHFDAFPSRPTRGWRILRLYVNINPTDDRVWLTSDTFAKVLEKYGEAVGLPGPQRDTWMRRLGHGILSLFQPNAPERSDYDDFMLRLHHFLKMDDEFQERAARKLWRFKPSTAWLLFSDTVSHAELRGQYALEHSFFVAPRTLALPDESPPALLERKSGVQVLPIAA
ncbi:MAG: Kdo hydroxylase family protein [Planctomycetes bacterium]|nr:Kdo hydroxylase family protein [Planctomycetota bacterium]